MIAMGAFRYWYSYGFKTRNAAEIEIEWLYSTGEISPADQPIIASYTNENNERRFGVKLLEA